MTKLISKMLMTCQVCGGDGCVCAEPDRRKWLVSRGIMGFHVNCGVMLLCILKLHLARGILFI
jgi:hypothetical protein